MGLRDAFSKLRKGNKMPTATEMLHREARKTNELLEKNLSVLMEVRDALGELLDKDRNGEAKLTGGRTPTVTTAPTIERVERTYDVLLAEHLKKEEGCNLRVHDVQGIPHVGYGRSLNTKGLSDAELEMIGVEDEDDIEAITQEQAGILLKNDIIDAAEDARRVVGDLTFLALSAVRKTCLVSIAFNVGGTGLSKFRKMLAAIKDGDFDEAAAQMLDSRAAKTQAPNRYRRMAEAMRTNDEAAFELG